MQFYVITIFPEIFDSFLATSLIGKARADGRIEVCFVDPRDYTSDRHQSVDDTPYGGGEGMVMKPEPLIAALESIRALTDKNLNLFRILLSPQGEPMTQAWFDELSQRSSLVLLCGRYEGFDERVRSFVDLELSLGDFVLNGGEVAAMALIDGVTRLIPGVVGNPQSLETESHKAGLLEYPQFTRPRVFRELEVPEVLLSGDHARIREYRHKQMLLRTRERRPDLWQRYSRTDEDQTLLGEDDPIAHLVSRCYIALLHHPVLDRDGKEVTTAITNLDIHDIARSSRTYGLAGYFIVTPLESQRELAERIISHWRTGHGAKYNKRRSQALSLLQIASTLEEVIIEISEREGETPLSVVTSAIRRPGQVSQQEVLKQAGSGPLLLILGTGWGLTDEALQQADLALSPLRGRGSYNHLSVRSAAAILLDRFFGLRD